MNASLVLLLDVCWLIFMSYMVKHHSDPYPPQRCPINPANSDGADCVKCWQTEGGLTQQEKQ